MLPPTVNANACTGVPDRQVDDDQDLEDGRPDHLPGHDEDPRKRSAVQQMPGHLQSGLFIFNFKRCETRGLQTRYSLVKDVK